MSVKFVVVPRRNPRAPEDPVKYYAHAKSRGETTVRELANRIAEISTVSSVDTLAAIEAFLKVVPQEVAAGNIVRLGDFGSYNISIKSEGSATAEEVTSTNIKGNAIHFRPGKEFKRVTDAITYEKE